MTLLSKKCPGCGESGLVTESTGALRWLNRVDAYCEKCIEVKVAKQEQSNLREELKRRYFTALNSHLLSEHFRSASFAESKKELEEINPEAWGMARGWTRKANLYICGPTGTGKTFMALGALRRAFVQGLDVAEVTARRFCKVSDTFTEGHGLLEAWKKVDVLLFDDIDKATWKLERVDALWELLNA